MKKFITCAAVVLFFMGACDFSDNYRNNCPKEEKYFDIRGIQLKRPPINPEYNYGYNPADSLAFKDFGLDVLIEATYYSFVKPGFSFIPAAYATSPCVPAGYLGSQEQLVEMFLITINDYDQQFKAGDTLNSIVTIRSQSTGEEIPFNAYLNKTRQEGIKDQYFAVRFTQKPDPKGMKAFRIILKLKNGETYSAESSPLKIFLSPE